MTMEDPFYVVKDEVFKALNKTRGLYLRWQEISKAPVAPNSPEVEWTSTELRNALRSIEWDLEDLEDTISIVEKNSSKFKIDNKEISDRRTFIEATKQEVKVMKGKMSLNRNRDADGTAREPLLGEESPMHFGNTWTSTPKYSKYSKLASQTDRLASLSNTRRVMRGNMSLNRNRDADGTAREPLLGEESPMHFGNTWTSTPKYSKYSKLASQTDRLASLSNTRRVMRGNMSLNRNRDADGTAREPLLGEESPMHFGNTWTSTPKYSKYSKLASQTDRLASLSNTRRVMRGNMSLNRNRDADGTAREPLLGEESPMHFGNTWTSTPKYSKYSKLASQTDRLASLSNTRRVMRGNMSLNRNRDADGTAREPLLGEESPMHFGNTWTSTPKYSKYSKLASQTDRLASLSNTRRVMRGNMSLNRNRDADGTAREPLLGEESPMHFGNTWTSTPKYSKYSKLASQTDSPNRFDAYDSMQEKMLVNQDDQLQVISNSVGSLKTVSKQIGIELDEQAGMLDDLNTELENADSKLDSTIKKVAKVLHMNNERRQWLAIGILLGLLVIILILFIII
ncbi:uncharacterized protein LOC134661853 [Cydia amplana]|uniref:uncharacterized protein LOC134661853 n=1 Tax=Cydia amplana TaxID=1869771 RepID=UPI002FE60A36